MFNELKNGDFDGDEGVMANENNPNDKGSMADLEKMLKDIENSDFDDDHDSVTDSDLDENASANLAGLDQMFNELKNGDFDGDEGVMANENNPNDKGEEELKKFFAEMMANDSYSSDTNDITIDLHGNSDGQGDVIESIGEDEYTIEQLDSQSSSDAMAVDDTQYPLEQKEEEELALTLAPPKDELEILLQGFPEKRIQKVRDVMMSNLGKPSMLQLVPILRENMPDHISKVWLRQKNLLDASTVMESAEEQGVVDRHLLTSMLEVVAKSGSVDKAIAFHAEEFSKKNIVPTAYCDRILLQMLIENRRVSRALEFKEKIESQGKHLDLVAYGSLCNHYANHGHLGSAILTLKECISVHGTPPGEKSLSRLRLMCRKHGVHEDADILKLIGRDPLQWLKEGEHSLKREYTKKGRRQVDLPANNLLRL